MPASEGASLTTSSEVVERIRERAQFVRLETVRLISIAKTGHYSSTFSCAEILATLYYGVLRLRHGDPQWPDRDRFVMGKGHAAVGLYPILADHGFFDPELLDGYTRLGNPLGDHPDMTKVPGCDFSSGSLGHNLSVGLGMALGARMTGRDFNVYALLGDGELHEGQIWEAAAAAGHYGLGNLVAIVDRNGYCLDGKVDDIITIEPLADRWRAFGWDVVEVDGHDVPALLDTLLRLRDGAPAKPTAVIAHTVKGKGVGFMERDFGWHLGWLAEQDEAAVIRELKGEK
ncbi:MULTISPECIES: transketolase [Nonomuraea]|uniref:Transketolase n=1 Tax=Nonomuraea ferruginea TaxID=46174 RepID=A0ABT4T316_9ACTN|nr:transketolase [Nonomuraea ferruginea]MDA0643872.1 transketolase [Nonomuraea ferruginea]